jgi:hypothetical protein
LKRESGEARFFIFYLFVFARGFVDRGLKGAAAQGNERRLRRNIPALCKRIFATRRQY